MGIAAYNRASQVIAQRISYENPLRHTAFLVMDRINAMPKFQRFDAFGHKLQAKCTPMSDDVVIEFDKNYGVWFMMHPEKLYEGYSRCYQSLEDCIRNWDIFLTGYDETKNRWTATSLPQSNS